MQVSGIGQAQMLREEAEMGAFKCWISIDGFPPTMTTTAFMWCFHCQQLDFVLIALPFLILNHLPWLKAQLLLKCSVFSKMVLDLP